MRPGDIRISPTIEPLFNGHGPEGWLASRVGAVGASALFMVVAAIPIKGRIDEYDVMVIHSNGQGWMVVAHGETYLAATA